MNTLVEIELVPVTCYLCGVVFGIESTQKKRLVNNGAYFHCPNGHPQHYVGETEAQKLKRQLALKSDLLDTERQRNTNLKNQVRAQKGVNTRIKNRIAAGVCPCCNRTFQDLAAHMQTKHPTYKKES